MPARWSVTMSSSMTPEGLACIRDDARLLASRAADHEEVLQDLVRRAETLVDSARATHAASAIAGATDDETVRGWAALASASVASADAARRACLTAREQHVTAARLLARFDDDSAERTAARLPAAVLVVDDVEELRELVAVVLRRAGFVVRTAANGAAALIAAHEMQPAVIVMDVTMPVLDGVEATRLIKAIDTIRHAKVIAHTADPSIPDALVPRLFAAVVPKPSSPDAVLAAVQTVAAL
jgi:CheY-like chemotaxis protein